MRLKVLVNSTNYSDAALVEGTRIAKEISGRVSTAEIAFVAGRLALYDEALYDTATYGVDASELADVELRDLDTDALLFAGYIAETRRSLMDDGEQLRIDCTCRDWTTLLDAVIPAATFTGQTDRAIVQALVATYAPRLTALTANIASTATLGYFEVKERSLRDALDELAELTGCEYRVDFERNLHYFTEGAFPAAFGLSTARNEYRIDDYTRDAKGLVNRAIVLGGLIAGGTEIRVQYDDPISQAEYGIHETTIVDRQISLAAEALLRAQAVVEANAYPVESGKLVAYKDGLDIGQSVDLYHAELAVNGTYIIRSMGMSWLGDKETVEYAIEFGARRPTIERLLRMLEARNRRATAIPTAVPADGSVTNASMGEAISAEYIGTVNADSIIGLITSSQIGSVNATAIFGAITSSQIGSVNATTIQGAITAGQIGSVNATTIQGVIISSQVADDLIDRLSLYSDAYRPIPRLAADPTLPDAEYPEGASIYNTTLGVFRQVQSGAWATVTESTAVTGKLEYWHVGTIKAGSIIGLIAAGQIDSIAASQITGAITASQIGGVNASAIVGTITAAQIASVNASAIQGAISAGQITSIAATQITGTLISSQIGSVAASTITGTLTASQIASVNATSISGSITSGQIGSINAATITIGTIQNSQIASVSASKLTAGTIDASVINVTNLSASNITSGSMSASRIAAGTISASITINAPTITGTMALSGAVLEARNAGGGFPFVQISSSSVRLYSAAGSPTIQLEPGFAVQLTVPIYMNGFLGYTGTQPVGTRAVVKGGIVTGFV